MPSQSDSPRHMGFGQRSMGITVKKTTGPLAQEWHGKGAHWHVCEFRVREIGDVYYLFIDDLKNHPRLRISTGNSWFAIDDSYRVPARFVAYEEPEEVRIPMTHIEWKKPMQSTGDVVFTLGGPRGTLEIVYLRYQLNWLPSCSQTKPTATETYGGGRLPINDSRAKRRHDGA